MHIIPAIDIIDGKCVRLTQGDYAQKKEYAADPLDMALRFEDAGLQRLHVVDLDGAREKRVINYRVLERLASKTGLHIDFGGGIQSDDDLRIAFECGAKQITGGSIAVREPDTFERWLKEYGPEKIILGADARDMKIAVSGWQESSGRHIFDFLEEYQERGVRYAISTDVAKDGLLQGPSIHLYQELRDRFPDLHVIASGGVSSLKDLEELEEVGVWGVIVGKAIYEGRIQLKDLAPWIAS
ncbi:phosphoribosylformimino-5-aminoimidazole carboxamide ribotide isomerase [Catalinimonas alkaloidigena]|uniref:1-(5-phosphoribosyl)-5-[(5-phosphoribosylamino)methylideneamino] imidazole-4-carboxamide isomerase n=1 Tax=Catalinimonas alkaloidigena TaxID=1075417 RepID=A0A1G9IWB1_9BACT|nr:1-(5-phosphoribosyl)-5-[(5-phosphoribosylamino)methylideneamino]imidazole-4-carboxamide isomerase [Catalinimonas alkaloidigena]SDL29480.1 phosphoribosylformimino-5-aminoimidazole carboxamide ribotide isomerase [Catalinimonas alkaloidigena]